MAYFLCFPAHDRNYHDMPSRDHTPQFRAQRIKPHFVIFLQEGSEAELADSLLLEATRSRVTRRHIRSQSAQCNAQCQASQTLIFNSIIANGRGILAVTITIAASAAYDRIDRRICTTPSQSWLGCHVMSCRSLVFNPRKPASYVGTRI